VDTITQCTDVKQNLVARNNYRYMYWKQQQQWKLLGKLAMWPGFYK